MRIKSRNPSTSVSFWQGIKEWLCTPQGRKQFATVFLAGVLLTAVVAALYGSVAGRWVHTAFTALDREATSTVKDYAVTNDLPTMYLDIGFREFQFLRAKRDEAWRTGILINSDSDWQKAIVRFQGKAVPVHVRLKGDWSDHLHDKKWSFRIKTRHGKKIMGMHVFSVQAPWTRNYVNQWLYFQDLRQAGLLTPRYTFINLVVNGEKWGIYALEESFAKELLESQGRRAGVIVRFDENLSWLYRAGFGDSLRNLYPSSADRIGSTIRKEKFALVDDFESTKVQSDPILREERDAAISLLRGFESGKLSVSQVFDPEQFGRYMAHNNLWSERHGLLWHNERYYYNPLTAHLEPIAYDSLPLAEFYGPFTDLARYDDPAVMKAYVDEVNRIADPAYLQQFQAKFGAQYEHYRQVLGQEFPLSDMKPPWPMLAERQRLLRIALRPPQTVYAYLPPQSVSSSVDLKVANILRYPVVLQKLRVGKSWLPVNRAWISPRDRKLLYPGDAPILRSAPEQMPVYLTLHLPETALQRLVPTGTTVYSHTWQLVTSLYAVNRPITVTVKMYYPPLLTAQAAPTQPTVKEALERYPFLTTASEDGFLKLRPGTWSVNGDLILPDKMGLMADQPVTLTFGSGAILYANGPLHLDGPEPDSIRLLPKGSEWGGIMVNSAGQRVSLLHHVLISGTTGIRRSGWIASGGVTFYKSPLLIDGCRLLHTKAGDDINMVHSKFEIRNSEFAYTASDAIDGDFVQGSIHDCSIHDLGLNGDGVDMCGSRVRVDRVRFQHIYDKGISAGEQSVITATRVFAEDVAMAVASKDLSRVRVDDISVRNARIAGLAAYQKKEAYGPATIIATNVRFLDSSPHTLVQKGSKIKIDNVDAPTTTMNIKTFYRRLSAVASMRKLQISFGRAIRLEGTTLFTPKVKAGKNLEFSLYWRAVSVPDKDYTVFVHVLDPSGRQVAQRDVMPANNSSRTSGWRRGQFLDDFHKVAIPRNALPGTYQVQIGLYDWKTGVRLPAVAADGKEYKDDIVDLTTFQVGR